MKTLVRYWRNGYQTQPITAFVDNWEQRGDRAQFTIPADHPLSCLWHDVLSENWPLTVYSTEQLEWSVDTISKDAWGYGDLVECVSRLSRLRQSLRTDEYLIWLWLDAEKRWHDSTA